MTLEHPKVVVSGRDLANSNPMNVSVVDGSGDQVTSFGGGTEYTEGDVDASVSGKAILWEDAGDTLRAVSAAKPLPVDGSGVTQPVSGTVTANLSATVNAVLDAIQAAVEVIDNMISGSEAQVDVVTLPALVAGTAAIGKLLPPDIDVTAHTNYARKYYTNAGAVTDGIIWSPAAGKRWHVMWMYIQVSAAATITLEDDKSGGDDPVWKGEFAANQGISATFPPHYPKASGEDAADLIITTSAGNVYVTVLGYEV